MSPRFTTQRSRYEMAQRAARAEQEASGITPKPLGEATTKEQEAALRAIEEKNKAEEERRKREDAFGQNIQELTELLKNRRPGNVSVSVPNSYMKMWFALPAGVPDKDENLIPLIKEGGSPLIDEEVLTMAVELAQCEKDFTDRIVRCGYEVDDSFGKKVYTVVKRYRTLTASIAGKLPVRELIDGRYKDVIINMATSTRAVPMIVSQSTQALGDDVILAIAPSYKKAKINSFDVKGGKTVVDETPTVTLEDLPSSLKGKK